MDKLQELKHEDVIHVMGQKLYFYYPENSEFNEQTNKRNELPPPNFFKVIFTIRVVDIFQNKFRSGSR
jgi:hypothetical protein